MVSPSGLGREDLKFRCIVSIVCIVSSCTELSFFVVLGHVDRRTSTDLRNLVLSGVWLQPSVSSWSTVPWQHFDHLTSALATFDLSERYLAHSSSTVDNQLVKGNSSSTWPSTARWKLEPQELHPEESKSHRFRGQGSDHDVSAQEAVLWKARSVHAEVTLWESPKIGTLKLDRLLKVCQGHPRAERLRSIASRWQTHEAATVTQRIWMQNRVERCKRGRSRPKAKPQSQFFWIFLI